MSGVDQTDQYDSKYCFLKKSLKSWRKLFFFLEFRDMLN